MSSLSSKLLPKLSGVVCGRIVLEFGFFLRCYVGGVKGGDKKMKFEKKDGSLEGFDRSKIASGISAAGAEEAAEQIAAQVEEWAKEAASDDTVTWSAVREKVLELLRASNPEAATNFEEYKK